MPTAVHTPGRSLKAPCHQAPAAVVAVDLDNLTVAEGGFDRVDIARFMKRVVAELGRNCIIKVFTNGMSAAAEAIWNGFGAEVIRTGTNADPYIEEFLFGADDACEVLIVSGDHGFANVARWHSSLKHRVVVWARRAKAAYELVFAADRIEFIDDLILPRRIARRA